jgi:hypothetical protein
MKLKNPLPKTPPGALCAQMVRCGKPNCKCASGELHGPYSYRFARVNGVLIKRYVKVKDVPQLRAMCDVRRQEDRRHRRADKLNAHQLMKAIEQLRENERFLLRFLGNQS